MQIYASAFYDVAIKLSLLDVIKLLIGRHIKEGRYIFGLWSTPYNNCPCETCKRIRRV